MTKVLMRFALQRPLDERLMPRLAATRAVYGIVDVKLDPSLTRIAVEYDASRLWPTQVTATLLRAGIAAEPQA